MSSAAMPHVVLLPMPAQGHINPFTSLARFLAASGISVTLVHSPRNRSLLSSPTSRKTDDANMQGSIRVEVMSADAASLDNFIASIPFMCKGLEEILHKLMQEENAPCCLIADPLLPWSHDVALKFGLPRVELWPCCAAVVSLGVQIPELVARGYIPAVDHESKRKSVDFIPGLSPIRIAEMPDLMVAEEGLQSPGFQFYKSVFEHTKSTVRMLMDTIYDLDRSVLEALRTESNICIDPVGPLFMMTPSSSTGSSLLSEDNSCLAWLEQQCESSVLYISFGSMATIEKDVFEELAHGLEASGERFLWVIRRDAAHKDKAMTPEELLPKGFMERTGDRGRIISWAPQLAVLGHPSVGAFLTHCGWNSILESLSNGIPMLGFPQQAEQQTNLKLVVHDWGVGLPLLEADAHKVEKTDVQRAVNAIMTGVEGMEVRKRALEWRDIAHKAPHGTSRNNLQKFVDDLKTGQLKPLKTLSPLVSS